MNWYHSMTSRTSVAALLGTVYALTVAADSRAQLPAKSARPTRSQAEVQIEVQISPGFGLF
jgi:hypothetical protein